MRSISKLFSALALGVGLAIASIGSAAAQPQPNIAVPTPTPGGSFEGCYTIGQSLYGNYYMGFCLDRYGQGTYGISGQITCNGKLTWSQLGASANVQLAFTNCTRNTSWSGDTMNCTIAGGPLYGAPGGFNPQVAVPTPTPGGNGLNCGYYPSQPGYAPQNVFAQRAYK